MFKTIAVFVILIVGFVWVVSLLGIGYASPVLIKLGPVSDSVSYMGLIGGMLLIGIPVLGLILWLSAIVFRYNTNSTLKTSLWTVWFLSLFTTSYSAMTTVKEYQSYGAYSLISDYAIPDNDIHLTLMDEPSKKRLGVMVSDQFFMTDNGVAVNKVRLKIDKSADHLVHIERKVSGRGTSESEAKINADQVINNYTVTGNTINLSKYLIIPDNKKFRNQTLTYTIFIPEGKNVIMDENVQNWVNRVHVSKDYGINIIDEINTELKDLTSENGAENMKNPETEWDNSPKSEKVKQKGYGKILIENTFDVLITQGAETGMKLSGNSEEIKNVLQSDKEGTLRISYPDGRKLSDIQIEIITPDLDFLSFEDIKSVRIDGFTQDRLKIISKADNKANISKISLNSNIKALDISVDGAQDLLLSGKYDKTDIQLENGARLQGEQCTVKTAHLSGQDYRPSTLVVTGQVFSNYPEKLNFTFTGNPQIQKL
ncbi:MAG: DUF2807 domain-containing protein [Saprospiraceae bacterium]|nr:DUF2807 domain-containing protein [Saprospiraceae bacterium]